MITINILINKELGDFYFSLYSFKNILLLSSCLAFYYKINREKKRNFRKNIFNETQLY